MSGVTDINASHYQEFNTPVQTLTASGSVFSNCADILFINKTLPTVLTGGQVTVNNYVLNPGDYIGFSCNDGEINTDNYYVSFGPNATIVNVVKRLYTKK